MEKRRTKKEYPILKRVAITGVAAGGKSLARVNDMVVFIPFGAPGDIVDVRVLKQKKNYMEGEIVEFHQFAPERLNPFCEHFGTCGGCKWQHLPYLSQLKYKRKEVEDALQRIGGFADVMVNPVLPSLQTEWYRNKLEFTFTRRRWLTTKELDAGQILSEEEFMGLGFHLPGAYDRIMDIHHCYLQPKPSNEIRNLLKNKAIQLEIPFYDHRAHTGILRNITLRNNSLGEFMLLLSTAVFDERVAQLLDALREAFPQIVSINYVLNNKPNDDISDLKVTSYYGEGGLIEALEGIKFRIGPGSFFQTNGSQAAQLYDTARRMAGLTGAETVYDLYTGTGTIATFLSKEAEKVVGIEYVEDAIADARVNAAENGIHNVEFIAGDMQDVLDEYFTEKYGNPHVVITDPPRAGMHPAVVARILEMGPDRIVYISCNPSTQARDMAQMSSLYEIVEVQPVDMFPHTHHIENVVLLKRRNIRRGC